MYEIIKSDQNRIQQIQLLLMNPNGEENIKRRIKEIVRKVDKDELDNHKNDVLRSQHLFQDIFKSENEIKFEIKHFDESLIWNIIIADEIIFVGFYLSNTLGPYSPLMIVSRNSILGYSFEKYFNDVWMNRSQIIN